MRRLGALVAVLALVVAACGDDDAADDLPDPADDPTENGDAIDVPDGPTIVIGAQDFGESSVLAQVYGQALEAAGYPVSYQSLGGFREVVYSSFDGGDISFTAEYAASALEFLNENAGEATPDAQETTELLRGYLAERDLAAGDPASAVNTNSFVVTADTAEEYGLARVSDLADVADEFRLGGPPDCDTNPFCIPALQEVYDIDLSDNFVPLDGGGPLTVSALQGREIEVAILFSTSGVIADEGWVVLEDDEGMFNADNIVPVYTAALVDAYGDDFVDLVDRVSAALDTGELTELNRRFEIDAEDADAVARDFLESAGLA